MSEQNFAFFIDFNTKRFSLDVNAFTKIGNLVFFNELPKPIDCFGIRVDLADLSAVYPFSWCLTQS